jgi:hypothetical protein
MLEFLLDPGMKPFSFALTFVAGLLMLELLMSLVGLSMTGDAADGADAADLGELDMTFDAPDVTDALDVEALDLDGLDVDALDVEAAEALDTGVASPGLSTWLGFGQVPFILWLAGMLTAFGLSGYLIQLGAVQVLGGQLAWFLAVGLAVPPTLIVGRWFARTLARIVPKTETSAINRRSLGGRIGVISQGTAREDSPAQARVRDGHGNMHFVRVIPADAGVELPAGTEVLVMSGPTPVLRAIPIDDIPKK